MRHALEKWEGGIERGGKLYNNLRYADDVALLATTEGKLQELVNAVGKASERFGLSLNAKKTQVMVIGRHTSTITIMYNGAPLEQVKQFIYLGASFNEKGDTIKEVKRRVAIAKRASGDLHRIRRNRELPIPLKRKLVQLMIWPIMSYGSETWIYLKSVQNMINVFERWCYRRMLRISWTEHVTNEEVFNRANTKPTLLDGLLKETTGFPWSPSKERWHHTRPDDWTPTWNQTQRKTKNHLAEGPRYTSKHQLQRGDNHTER